MNKPSMNFISWRVGSSTKGGIARNITEMAVKWVLADLEKRGLLGKSGK